MLWLKLRPSTILHRRTMPLECRQRRLQRLSLRMTFQMQHRSTTTEGLEIAVRAVARDYTHQFHARFYSCDTRASYSWPQIVRKASQSAVVGKYKNGGTADSVPAKDEANGVKKDLRRTRFQSKPHKIPNEKETQKYGFFSKMRTLGREFGHKVKHIGQMTSAHFKQEISLQQPWRTSH